MKSRQPHGYTSFKNVQVVGEIGELGNGLELNPGAAGAATDVKAVGDDTNVGLSLTPKGVANIHIRSKVVEKTTITTDTTAGALTYTAAMLLGGLILRDPNGGNRSDVTPTAALLLAALPGFAVGDTFEFTIRNTADAAETITVTAGTGCTLSGTMTIAQNNSKRFLVQITGAAAYTVYSLGTVVH